MKIKERPYRNKRISYQELDLKDLLTDNTSFKKQFNGSFDQIFGPIIYSYNSFNLYICQLYKNSLRSYYLAKWIVNKFIELLYNDLVYENDRFKFPHKSLYLSIKDVNEYRIHKRYIPYMYGKNYRPFFEYRIKTLFLCRLYKIQFKQMIKHAKTNPYQ
jgi:hypothetical protein